MISPGSAGVFAALVTLLLCITNVEASHRKHEQGHHGRGSDVCDCDYHPGGCSIIHAPPPNKACYCKYKGFWTCGGEITKCAQSAAYHCKNPDSSLATCLQGGGDCGAYPDRCDCNYHSGGCKISKPSIAHTACKCIYKGAWTCGGTITRCNNPTSKKCTNPDSTKESCNEGNGDCGAY